MQKRRRWRPFWRKWLIFGLILLAGRLVLPLVFAPLLATRLSRALGTRVDIGDLSFEPIDAILTLRRVTVHARSNGTGVDPPIVAQRVRVDLQWLPLMHDTLRVREVILESGRVDVDRFADGSFGLANIERPDASRELPSGWIFALDRIVLRMAQLRVRDLANDGAALVDVTLRNAEISGLQQRRATAFGKSTNLRIDGLVGDGRIRARGRYDMRDDGLALDVVAWIQDIGLASAKPYVAQLGWTDLRGEISGRLRWQREPRRRDMVNGRVVLRRARVGIDGIDEAALNVRRIVADIGAIDLLGRRIAVSTLRMSGAILALRPELYAPIALITPSLSQFIAKPASSPAAARWNWMVERLDAADGRLRILATDGPIDLRMQMNGESLGPDAYWSPLRIQATRDPLALAFDGIARMEEGLSIEGHLTAGGIEVADLVRGAPSPWAAIVQSGHVTADLNVIFDTSPGDEPPFSARGGIDISDLWVAGSDPGVFAIGAPKLHLVLDGFSQPKPRGDIDSEEQPIEVKFSGLHATSPYVLLTHSSDGWLFPPFQAIETATDDIVTPPPTVPPAWNGPDIVLANLRCDNGRLIVLDNEPEDGVTWNLRGVRAAAQRVSLSPVAIDDLHLSASDDRFGPLQIGLTRRGEINQFEIVGEDVPLTATNTYVGHAGLPYYFAAGRGTISVRGVSDDASWKADAELKMRSPVLAGRVESLEYELGMSVASATAQLRDLQDDVTVRFSLSGSGDLRSNHTARIATGIRDTIKHTGEVMRAALAAAIPLPMATLSFSPGQAELSRQAQNEIASIGGLLRSRAELNVELSAGTSSSDRRWLAEQALHIEPEETGGLKTFLRAFGVRDQIDRIRTALAKRATGASGPLDRDDEALLGLMIAQAPPVSNERVAALRDARLTRVMHYLADGQAVDRARIMINGDETSPVANIAAVQLQVRRPPAPELSTSSAASPLVGPPAPAAPRH